MIIISSPYYLLGGPILNSVIWIGLRLQVWTEILDDQAEFTTDQSQKVSKYPIHEVASSIIFTQHFFLHSANSLISPRN